MKNKLSKFIATILIINMLFIQISVILPNEVFADFFDNVKNEGKAPPKPTPKPDDDKGKVPDPTPDIEIKDTKKSYTYYTGIKGIVNEQIYEESSIINDYSNKPGVPYVKVEAGGVTPHYTSNDGNYHISISSGSVGNLKFTYGKYESGDNLDKIKSKLKYNGLDYMVSYAGGSVTTTDTIMEKTIKYKGKAATQVILAIDGSTSTLYTKLPDSTSRFATQIEAAKKLVESLLKEEKDVYISIIVFAGTDTAWRIHGLTNNKEVVLKTLDEAKHLIENKIHRFADDGTDMISALNKVDDSFDKFPESKKWIVLLSDGVPTADNKKNVIYNNDTREAIIQKLNGPTGIIQNTKKKLISLLKDDINICTFITESTDETEKNYVQKLFCDKSLTEKESYKYATSSDEKTIETLKNVILKHIIDTKKEEEIIYKDTETVITKFDGIEDKARRAIVKQNYQNYDYKTSTDINNWINNYNNTMKSEATAFLNNTYMTVNVPVNKTFDSYKGETEDYWVMASGKKLPKDEYHKPQGKVITVNLELRQREQVDIQLDVKVTGYRLTLANGSVYKQIVTNGIVDKDLAGKAEQPDIKDIADSIYVSSVDANLMYGAKVDIEYTMVLTNDTVPIANVTLINYLTDINVENSPILNFDENARMISNKYTNAQYGWEKVEKTYLQNQVSPDTYNLMKNDYYVTMNTDDLDAEALRKGYQIGSGGKRYIKLVLSRFLSSDTKNDSTDFSTSAEVLNYKNNASIRMKKTYIDSSTGVASKITVIPGNSTNGLSAQVAETDYDVSMRILVIPPTGGKVDIALSVAIFVEVLLIVLFRRLRHISKK